LTTSEFVIHHSIFCGSESINHSPQWTQYFILSIFVFFVKSIVIIVVKRVLRLAA